MAPAPSSTNGNRDASQIGPLGNLRYPMWPIPHTTRMRTHPLYRLCNHAKKGKKWRNETRDDQKGSRDAEGCVFRDVCHDNDKPVQRHLDAGATRCEKAANAILMQPSSLFDLISDGVATCRKTPKSVRQVWEETISGLVTRSRSLTSRTTPSNSFASRFSASSPLSGPEDSFPSGLAGEPGSWA